MHADKVRSLDPGLIPAGCYFKRVARTLARTAAEHRPERPAQGAEL